LWAVAGVLALLVVAAAVTGTIILRGWMEEGAALARAHARFETTHPGWSFPGRVYSSEVFLEGTPAERLIAEARARGYEEDCDTQPPRRGTFCEARGTVVPRRGHALEPVLLGWLIGADAELRAHLPLKEAPPHLIEAILASEDREFRKHSGINLRSMIRASLANVREGGYAQGGSTLSMQVVRSLNGKREKELWRKLREMGLAMGLDRELGKDGVLQMYLDVPYLGQRNGLSVCGFHTAAWHYFGKDARDLTVEESAALVALLPSPGSLGPKLGTQSLRPRIGRVLHAMGRGGEEILPAFPPRGWAARARPLLPRRLRNLVAGACSNLLTEPKTHRCLPQASWSSPHACSARPVTMQAATGAATATLLAAHAVAGGPGSRAPPLPSVDC
jgi:hypothetical protein